jgi:uncharacterized protein
VAARIAESDRLDGAVIKLGIVVAGGAAHSEARVRLPLRMLDWHGSVAGASGTGKIKTRQLIAEQLAATGVPLFFADIKDDLSGLAAAGTPFPPAILIRCTAASDDARNGMSWRAWPAR